LPGEGFLFLEREGSKYRKGSLRAGTALLPFGNGSFFRKSDAILRETSLFPGRIVLFSGKQTYFPESRFNSTWKWINSSRKRYDLPGKNKFSRKNGSVLRETNDFPGKQTQF